MLASLIRREEKREEEREREREKKNSARVRCRTHLVKLELVEKAEKFAVLASIVQLDVVLTKTGELELRIIVNVDFHWLKHLQEKKRKRKGKKRGWYETYASWIGRSARRHSKDSVVGGQEQYKSKER